ncbi:TraB/GumN family protein [Sphingomonas sp. SUN039]|uniref:TraB/GumN family protein n=1 Tax=Sphingomonas sp. SUN039 TaxID=2937787 RepID=UPI0021641F2A|nr:TraB/GumN family protein [Sphingomonas sp. SUN039]UVO53969.1 TraB/GumN family protein [Sphingomonas sp. SUN039]
MIRIPTLATAALALAACGGTEAKAPATAARPALWKVADADTTIYLFGTIHLLPKGLKWTTPTMAKAMAASQGLVLEVALDKDPAKLGAVMLKLAKSPGLPPILDRVPPEKRAALKAVIDGSGLSLPYLDGLETWAAALGIASATNAKLNLSYADGAETQLTDAFEKMGKPVGGLETAEQQLGYFDTLPEASQRQFLTSIADDTADAGKEFAAMIGAWKAGDVRRIAVTFDDEMKLSPDLADVLLHRRNNNWAGWVSERMKRPGTVFVAVGAGHLAGKGSVEELVAKRGFRVTRVQ